MAPSLYAACVLGALLLYLLLRPAPRAVGVVAGLAGLGALAWIFKEASRALAPPGEEPDPFFVMFALLAVAGAVRLITHRRPVYAALYFVLVVLSSAGLFLLLGAEFMAFALVIVYAGAILITYLFVLMLAQQAREADDPSGGAEYDRIPREPAAAVAVGFVMLAVLCDVIVGPAGAGPGVGGLPGPPSALEVRTRAWEALALMPDRVEAAVRAQVPEVEEIVPGAGGGVLRIDGGDALVEVRRAGSGLSELVRLPDEAMPENIERVGLDLVGRFPASLELAGVILLLAMFGAVVLAQRQIEASEAERGSPAAGAAAGGAGGGA